MGSQTKIEYVDATWNPTSGCTRMSAGCDRCFAKRISMRFHGNFNVTLHPERLGIPLRWRKPRRILAPSTGDFFHAEVPDDFIDKILDVMERCYRHTFLTLTKRPDRMMERLLSRNETAPPIQNVWLGVSVENQEAANQRIPVLMETPAAHRWISIEPMIAPVDLARLLLLESHGYGWANPLQGTHPTLTADGMRGPGLDFVVLGGETGPGARPMDLSWAREVRDQCKASGVPFWFKQAGGGRETPPDLMIHQFPGDE